MVKKLDLRKLVKGIEQDIPLTKNEVSEIVAEDKQRKLDKRIADRSRELSTEDEPIDRIIPANKLGEFASKKTLTQFKNNSKDRGRAKSKPNILQTRSQIVDEVQSKEQQPEDFKKLEDVKNEEVKPETEIVSVGRLLTIIPSSSFGPSLEMYEKESDPSNNKTFVRDALRGRAGKYWTIDPQQKQFSFVEDEGLAKKISSYHLSFRDPVDTKEDTDFGRTEEWVDIKADVSKFNTAKNNYSKNYWKNFVSGGMYKGSTTKKESIGESLVPTVNTNLEYFDHVHEMPVPFSMKELKKMNTPLNGLSADIVPEYNFYIKGYENKISENTVLENTLPNMYVFLSELNYETPNPEFKNFITLDNTLKTEDKIFTKKESREEFDIKKHPIGQYYDLYSRQYDNALGTGVINRLSEKFSNILLSVDDVELLKQFNEKRELFPMYVDISFSTDKTTTFAQILKDTNLSNAFVSQMANLIIENDTRTMTCQQSLETIIQNNVENPKRQITTSEEQKRVWDMADLLAGLVDADEDLNSELAVYLADYQNKVNSLKGDEYKFFKTLMLTIFFGKLQKLIKQKLRSYQQLMSGKKAYSETVMYRVAKYEGEPGSNLIQSYYFPNSNEIDVLRFIDTQVKYDKQYSYVVYAYQMVIGNKYSYSNLDVDSFEQHAAFKVMQEPSLLLFEHEYYTFTGMILDDPPVIPDIDIVPYKGIDDMVLLLMNSNVGNYVTDPITIKAEDNRAITKLRKERQLDSGQPIRFKADDHVSMFEVYRLDKHPTSYEDFEGALRKVVQTDVNLKSLQSATAASFVDKIQPNKKYYYTFRSIDVHGNFSNPSAIMRVEMINERGTIFLLKDVVEFAEKEKISAKPARRYIQLVPNVLQTLINEEKSGFDSADSATELRNKVHLGVTDEPLWGKQFKIRLTSKSTGKKIDFKVKFAHEHKEKA